MKIDIERNNQIINRLKHDDTNFPEVNRNHLIKNPKIMRSREIKKTDFNSTSYCESEKSFQLLADIETSAIITITENGFMIFANRASEKIFGHLIDDMIGKHLTMLIPKYIHNVFTDALNKFIVTGKKEVFFQTVEFTGLHKTGKEIPLELSIGQHTVDGKRIITYMFRDRTDIKTSEDNKIKLQNQIYQLQRLETIGSLTNGIAHDFNNILTPILGFTELTMISLPKSSIEYSNLEHVKKAVYRAKELVEQISTFNQQHNTVELEQILIVPIVKEVLKLMRACIPDTIEIESEIDDDCGYITANSIQIHQILMNLCTNAFHAMKKCGGVLKVTLQLLPINEKNINPKKNTINLKVEDTGHGIESSIINKIFDPFFTTKHSNDGSGIGLSLVHDIVLNCKGKISVQSIPDKGTTFNVNFPQTSSELKTNAKEVQKSFVKGNETILYVDNDREINLMAKRMLKIYGYKVETATNSIEALKLFHSNPNHFDLIITDQFLPSMTGMQLAKELICIKPDTPIILTVESSNVDIHEDILEDLRMLGINDFITKPIIPGKLVSCIRNALDNCNMACSM